MLKRRLVLKKYFIPDYYFDSIHAVTPGFLKNENIKALVLDIDNTLVTYGEEAPTDDVLRWIGEIKNAGIFVAIASNNREERVSRFNEKLSVFTVSKSGKPSRRSVFAVCDKFSVKPSETAVIGDQIFTDILCARRAGARAYLVTPLPYKENLFFKFKRALEKPIIRRFIKAHPDKCIKGGNTV